MAVYLYGIVRPGSRVPRGVPVVEPTAGPLRIVGSSGVGALVSDVAEDHVAMSRHNLRSHHDVVDQAAQSGVVLPARFGMVVGSDRAIATELLEPHQRWLRHTLEDLDGHVEMRVIARYDQQALLREAVRSSPRIAAMRKRVRTRPAAATYYDRIALGEAVMEELAGIQLEDGRELQRRLRPFVKAANEPHQAESGALRFAYLVDRRRVAEFEHALEQTADDEAARMTFEVVGPLAPWDFTSLPDGDAVAGGPRRRTRTLAQRGA